MPLSKTDKEPVRSADIFGYAILMRSENGLPVRVLVTDEALQDLATPPDSSLNRLAEYRSHIEAVASKKYDAGNIESDGSIRVTSGDVNSA
jgi:hypothetical protein